MIILDHPDDPLLDPGFEPCRDERCGIMGLHAAHRVGMKRGRQIRRCPVCNSEVVRVPRKRVSCSKCPWHIVNHSP
jgi:hypothetical protein